MDSSNNAKSSSKWDEQEKMRKTLLAKAWEEHEKRVETDTPTIIHQPRRPMSPPYQNGAAAQKSKPSWNGSVKRQRFSLQKNQSQWKQESREETKEIEEFKGHKVDKKKKKDIDSKENMKEALVPRKMTNFTNKDEINVAVNLNKVMETGRVTVIADKKDKETVDLTGEEKNKKMEKAIGDALVHNTDTKDSNLSKKVKISEDVKKAVDKKSVNNNQNKEAKREIIAKRHSVLTTPGAKIDCRKTGKNEVTVKIALCIKVKFDDDVPADKVVI